MNLRGFKEAYGIAKSQYGRVEVKEMDHVSDKIREDIGIQTIDRPPIDAYIWDIKKAKELRAFWSLTHGFERRDQVEMESKNQVKISQRTPCSEAPDL